METALHPKKISRIKAALKSAMVLLAVFFSAQLSAQDTFPCKTPWIPPNFAVGETHWDEPTSFWQNGGHIPENVVDEDTTNYARAHIKATGSATLNVFDLNGNTYTSGYFVGFFVKSRAFRDTIFDGVTVTTYLNGIMQESYSGDDLIVDHIPFYVNEPICIGFITTRDWDELEIRFDTAGGRVHYDVFYAILGQCLEELPPPLPITWLSFEAQKKGEASDLKWITAQEFNNTGFHVERSADGRYFELIGIVDPLANPAGTNEYYFMDMHPLRGQNYYRIVQVDLDGNRYYSGVRMLNFANDIADITSWPNPAFDNINIMMPDGISNGEIKLVSSNGVIVLTKTYDSRSLQQNLDISGIHQGLYSLIIESPGHRYIQKITILK